LFNEHFLFKPRKKVQRVTFNKNNQNSTFLMGPKWIKKSFASFNQYLNELSIDI